MNSQRNPEESKRRSCVVAGIGALVFTICLSGYSGYASAATLYAGTCGQNPYATITAAIIHAASGDTVRVCPGTYDEEVGISKSLTLEEISSDHGTLLPTIRYPHSVDKKQCLPSFLNTCPQILVTDATNVMIRSLNVDGSDYDSGCELAPVGILFYDASGNAQNNTIVNHDFECDGHSTPFIGDGMVGGIDIAGNFSVSASNNTFSNVGEAGIGLTANPPESSTSAKLTGDLIDNAVSLSYSSSIGIASFFTTGVTIAGNKVTSTAEATVGFAIEKGAQDQLIVGNTIEGANAAISLQEVSDSGDP